MLLLRGHMKAVRKHTYLIPKSWLRFMSLLQIHYLNFHWTWENGKSTGHFINGRNVVWDVCCNCDTVSVLNCLTATPRNTKSTDSHPCSLQTLPLFMEGCRALQCCMNGGGKTKTEGWKWGSRRVTQSAPLQVLENIWEQTRGTQSRSGLQDKKVRNVVVTDSARGSVGK